MTYEEALQRLFALRRFGLRPGLGPIEAALARLGHPERTFDAIHVAGTNGKGSIAAICEAVLRSDGRRVGLYTSPHLARFTERVRLGGVEISRDAVVAAIEAAFAAGPELTFFELITAAAFVAFRDAGVELAVVEVGLGGRLDATNAIARPLVSIISNIALDHTEILGDTIAAIAAEKAGILRPGVPAVVGAVDDEARAVIAARAEAVGAPVAWLGRDFQVGPAPAHLLGPHQGRNAAVALAALSRLPSPPGGEAIADGLARVRWPGRLERLADDLLLDGAHNPDGARALAAALPDLAAGRPIHVVLGAVEEKDVRALASPLVDLATRVIATTVPSSRARSAAAIAQLLGCEAIDVPMAAVAAARSPGALTVVAGSLFLVGAVRAALLGEEVDPLVVQDPSRAPEKLSR